MRPLQKYALFIALTTSSIFFSLHASEQKTAFKSLSFYEGTWLELPLEKAQNIKAEDALFCEHTEEERLYFRQEPLLRLAQNARIKAVSGARLSFEHFELTASLSLFRTKITELPLLKQDSWGFTFGASGFVPSKYGSLQIKAGELSYSGSLSHIKNPYFSIPSVFTTDIQHAQSINASLPSFTQALSKEKKFSLYASIKPALSFLPTVSACFDSKNVCACINGSVAFNSKTAFAYALTAGTFSYAKTGGTSWFKTEKPFEEQARLSLMAEVELKNWQALKNLSANVYAAYMLYPNPFGGIFNAYRIQTHLTFKSKGTFSFEGGFSGAEEKTIDASGSTLNSTWQTYANVQYEQKGQSLTSKTGLTLYAQEDLLCIKCGQDLLWKNQAVGLGIETYFEPEAFLNKIKVIPQYSISTLHLTSQTKASFLFTPKTQKTVITLSQHLSFKKGIVSKLLAETEFTLSPDSLNLPQTRLSATFTNASLRIPFTFVLEIKL